MRWCTGSLQVKKTSFNGLYREFIRYFYGICRIFIHNVHMSVLLMTFFVNMSAIFMAFAAYLFITRMCLSF